MTFHQRLLHGMQLTIFLLQVFYGKHRLAIEGRQELYAGINRLQFQLTMEAIAGTYLRNKDNGKALTWAQRYFKDGGNSATMKQVLQNAQFLSGDMEYCELGSLKKFTQGKLPDSAMSAMILSPQPFLAFCQPKSNTRRPLMP